MISEIVSVKKHLQTIMFTQIYLNIPLTRSNRRDNDLRHR